jgi:hypothetical protein
MGARVLATWRRRTWLPALGRRWRALEAPTRARAPFRPGTVHSTRMATRRDNGSLSPQREQPPKLGRLPAAPVGDLHALTAELELAATVVLGVVNGDADEPAGRFAAPVVPALVADFPAALSGSAAGRGPAFGVEARGLAALSLCGTGLLEAFGLPETGRPDENPCA